MRARTLGAAAMVLALIGAAGPAPADTYPKNFDLDVLHYRFELTLSDASDRIGAVTTVQVRFLSDGVEGFELDLIGPAAPGGTGMTVESVAELLGEAPETLPDAGVPAADAEVATNTGVTLPHEHAAGRLRYSPDRTVSARPGSPFPHSLQRHAGHGPGDRSQRAR